MHFIRVLYAMRQEYRGVPQARPHSSVSAVTLKWCRYTVSSESIRSERPHMEVQHVQLYVVVHRRHRQHSYGCHVRIGGSVGASRLRCQESV